jgi:pimeloyl-ACP methyl ester carboxylesterase
MKKIYFLISFCSLNVMLIAQIGHATIVFNDATRSTTGFGTGTGPGRQIQTEIYYPAATSADNVPVVGSNLPVIVFGHGFVMSWDAYTNIWTDLVAQGYVVAFPRTEGGFSPTHLEFGKDLATVAAAMQTQNTTSGSIFNGKIANKTALMGHSMGGGSSYLAPTYGGANFTTIVTLAAAITNPTCVAPASVIATTIPNLVISGENDCVAKPLNHQDSIYMALNSAYKTQLTITGGSHCLFANSNFNCNFGESTCTPSPTITRSEQQDVTNDHINLWLGYYLKNICANATAFQDSLTSSNRTTFRQNAPLACSNIGLDEIEFSTISVSPNPSTQDFTLNNLPLNASWSVCDLNGRIILTGEENKINGSNLIQGIYFVTISNSTNITRTIKIKKD